ncbi:hypothetical protein [Pseudomonas aeruginosa]|uniref:hypothetical protein n=1 Tax=Pseudomonas aeruginosa TaxID=287 RepID=UPI001A9E98D8|nr:hypothetical protein [Pseudomonas aeruginosa]
MHTGETLAAAPPARPLRQSRLGGLSLFLALAGVAIALVVMALALGERIDLSDENHLLGLFAALLAVFAVSTCGLVLGLAGLRPDPFRDYAQAAWAPAVRPLVHRIAGLRPFVADLQGEGLSRGRRAREEQKVSPGGADLRGSCGTVVRAPGRDQRWKG